MLLAASNWCKYSLTFAASFRPSSSPQLARSEPCSSFQLDLAFSLQYLSLDSPRSPASTAKVLPGPQIDQLDSEQRLHSRATISRVYLI